MKKKAVMIGLLAVMLSAPVLAKGDDPGMRSPETDGMHTIIDFFRSITWGDVKHALTHIASPD